eukprot:GILJ01011056.1.p1 GENE.GILJ01011056.1~~GILJ01011056.1.p1  ORF type:complete len:297 (+),score=43.57 GILJ01011056.1:72-893(+)
MVWTTGLSAVALLVVLLAVYFRPSPDSNVWQAAYEGDSNLIRRYFQNATIDVEDAYGNTALHWAAKSGNVSTIQLLLELGASVNSRNKERGSAPLHWATTASHIDAVELLLDAKADVNIKNFNEETPLHWAAFWNQSAIVKTLLQRPNVQVNIPSKEERHTPLHNAVLQLNHQIAAELIQAQADVNMQDIHGNTPLHIVLLNSKRSECAGQNSIRCSKLIDLLVSKGADITIKNNDGQSCFDMGVLKTDPLAAQTKPLKPTDQSSASPSTVQQ